MNKSLSLYEELVDQYTSFKNKGERNENEFKYALFGAVPNGSVGDKYNKVQPLLLEYKGFLKPSQKKQNLLDFYDIWVIPSLGVLAIVILIAI